MLGGHHEVCQHLVGRCKADTNYEAMNGMNIVHAAVSSGVPKVVQFAMSKTPAKMHLAQTSTGSSVLHIAAGDMYMYLSDKGNYNVNPLLIKYTCVYLSDSLRLSIF